jgi:ferredoxin
MGYRVRIDLQSCLSSGRCVGAAPGAFGLDADHLAEVLPGVARLSDEQILEIARSCPAFAVLVSDADGNEVDV